MTSRTFSFAGTPLVALALLLPHPTQATTGLVLSGNEKLTITSNQTITGDIELSGDAVLTISGATVTVQRATGDPRGDVTLTDHARLVLENGNLIPPIQNPDNLYLTASGTSHVEIANGTFINVINLVDDATLVGTNARIASSAPPLSIPETAGAFGIVQLGGNATASLTDSTVGSFALFFAAGDEADLSNLKPGTYADFNLQRDATMFTPTYNVTLANTRVLPVKLKGPFERSWAIFVDPASKVTIRNSSLNKLVFQEFVNERLTFSNLKVDSAQAFDFRDVHLVNTTVANEWGFFGRNSSITVKNSRGVWLWPIGTGFWTLSGSQMIEFDPRQFAGTLRFVNAEWANAGEVFDRTAITLTGSVRMTQQPNEHLAVSASTIRRVYSLRLRNAAKKYLSSFTADVYAGTKRIAHTATTNGVATFSVTFSPSNFKRPLTLRVRGDGQTLRLPLTLFSTTPLILTLPR